MSEDKKLDVLFLAPFCDGNDVGEAFNSCRWAKGISNHVNLTVLSIHRKGQASISEQIPKATTYTWKEPAFLSRFERFNAMAKPSYINYYFSVRTWIKKALQNGKKFDVIHQMTPAALRYPSPAVGFNIPFIHGPVQGSLETPDGFKKECQESVSWYMKLRNIDRLRLKYDPILRKSIQSTAVILVGSDYAKELVSLAQPNKTEILVHLNIDGIVEHPEKSSPQRNSLRLLHVGRIVRTKGLIDSIRAIAQIDRNIKITMDVIGEGENLQICKEEAVNLGINNLIYFHGKQPRNVVEDFYAKSDVLIFPSFREPAGGVVIEAMRHGLPVIATNVGGPGYYVNQSCGFNVEALNPQQLANDLALSIEKIARDTCLFRHLQKGAYKRAQELGNFDLKLGKLLDIYKKTANSMF